jgi:tetratricopeptide (TPR) repeat protein
MKAKIIFTLLAISLSFIFMNEDVQGQTNSGPKFGEDSVTCVTNISLYREFYRQWKDSRYKSETVKDAIAPWRWVMLNCPKARQTTFVDGVRIMDHLIRKEKDQSKRELYIDTLLSLYDKRIELFGNQGPTLGRKGVDFYKYRTSEFEDAYNIFKQSVQIQKNKSQGPIIIYYFRTTVKMVKEEAIAKSVIVDVYDEVMNIIDFNVKKYQAKNDTRRLEDWLNVKGNIEAEFEPFATCEDLISIYQKKFDENKEDVELLKKITDILDKKKCVDSQLYFDATVQLYKLEPSPVSAYLIGRMFLKESKYNDALTYLSEAVNIEDVEKQALTYQYMAVCSQNLNRRSDARRHARKSIELNPENGDAYILIGDLYAASAASCGDNDLTNKVAYWAAVDKYAKAKRVDPSVEKVANSRIASYRKYYPTAETIFFYNLKEGDAYKVECWIQENTTIRAAK